MPRNAVPTLSRSLTPYVPTLLRITLGVIMAAHGWQKLTAMTPAGFGSGMLDGLGVPAPLAVAWVVTIIELVGGIALIAGIGSRIAAGLVSLVILGAIILVKLDIGLIAGPEAPLPGAELDLLVLAAALAVVVLGPGRLALDRMFGLDTTELALADADDVEIVVPEARAKV